MKAIGMARSALFAAFLACVVLCGPPGLSGASAARADTPLAQKAEDAARRSARSLDLQTDLPTPKRAPMKESAQPSIDPPDISADLSSAANILLWISIGLAVAVILMTIRDNLWSASRSRRLTREEEEEAAPAAAARMDKAQTEADDLARRGSFAEAMHVLLLQSVGELRRRLDAPISASLTSREILRGIGLPPEGREAFADIIGRVEISYFGGHQPGEQEYLLCRSSFEALTRSLGRGFQENPA